MDTVTLAQEILVDNASYPTEKIAKNSHDYRPLGLGYANLGALLMSMGVPYDSDQGRAWAGALTAILCGQSYLTSARIPQVVGPFPGYPPNEEPFIGVMRMHRDATAGIDPEAVPPALLEAAQECWDKRRRAGRALRLPQLADHGAGSHRHDRLHDGLRHHRHRARTGAGEI